MLSLIKLQHKTNSWKRYVVIKLTRLQANLNLRREISWQTPLANIQIPSCLLRSFKLAYVRKVCPEVRENAQLRKNVGASLSKSTIQHSRHVRFVLANLRTQLTLNKFKKHMKTTSRIVRRNRISKNLSNVELYSFQSYYLLNHISSLPCLSKENVDIFYRSYWELICGLGTLAAFFVLRVYSAHKSNSCLLNVCN
jgi:hypothetical protein